MSEMGLPTALSRSTQAERLMQLYTLRQRLEQEIALAEAALRRGRLPRRRPALCGTDSGYYHHRRQLQEKPCEPCKLAHAAAERDRARRRTAS